LAEPLLTTHRHRHDPHAVRVVERARAVRDVDAEVDGHPRREDRHAAEVVVHQVPRPTDLGVGGGADEADDDLRWVCWECGSVTDLLWLWCRILVVEQEVPRRAELCAVGGRGGRESDDGGVKPTRATRQAKKTRTCRHARPITVLPSAWCAAPTDPPVGARPPPGRYCHAIAKPVMKSAMPPSCATMCTQNQICV
jgi:hypothetical protein